MITDVLRQIILDTLPADCKEKFAYGVPFFYGNKRICLVWPASIKGGGIKAGVLLGFCQGYKLSDVDQFLEHGTNKQVYYKIYTSVNQVDPEPVIKLLHEAVRVDWLKC